MQYVNRDLAFVPRAAKQIRKENLIRDTLALAFDALLHQTDGEQDRDSDKYVVEIAQSAEKDSTEAMTVPPSNVVDENRKQVQNGKKLENRSVEENLCRRICRGVRTFAMKSSKLLPSTHSFCRWRCSASAAL